MSHGHWFQILEILVNTETALQTGIDSEDVTMNIKEIYLRANIHLDKNIR